jgi:hypothetical protein
MHIGLDFESNVSFLEQNTTKEKIGPSVFSFQYNTTSKESEHFKWPHKIRMFPSMSQHESVEDESE